MTKEREAVASPLASGPEESGYPVNDGAAAAARPTIVCQDVPVVEVFDIRSTPVIASLIAAVEIRDQVVNPIVHMLHRPACREGSKAKSESHVSKAVRIGSVRVPIW